MTIFTPIQYLDLLTVTGRRRRARRVNERAVAFFAMRDAIRDGYGVRADHGGSVNNSYGYRAYTECAGTACVLDAGAGVLHVESGFRSDVPANKVTFSGAAAHTLGNWARRDFDARMTGTLTLADIEANICDVTLVAVPAEVCHEIAMRVITEEACA